MLSYLCLIASVRIFLQTQWFHRIVNMLGTCAFSCFRQSCTGYSCPPELNISLRVSIKFYWSLSFYQIYRSLSFMNYESFPLARFMSWYKYSYRLKKIILFKKLHYVSIEYCLMRNFWNSTIITLSLKLLQ